MDAEDVGHPALCHSECSLLDLVSLSALPVDRLAVGQAGA